QATPNTLGQPIAMESTELRSGSMTSPRLGFAWNQSRSLDPPMMPAVPFIYLVRVKYFLGHTWVQPVRASADWAAREHWLPHYDRSRGHATTRRWCVLEFFALWPLQTILRSFRLRRRDSPRWCLRPPHQYRDTTDSRESPT